MNSAPLSDAVIIAVAKLVDDAQTETREPSHSDLDFQIKRASLSEFDPRAQGQNVGKAKRVRATLSWALEHNPTAGEQLVAALVSLIRALGGFRPTSPNHVGAEAIRDAANVFMAEGYELSDDGELRPFVLDNLSGAALTDALQSYIRRAKRGVADAALVTGTGKDLIEATAAHILRSRFGDYPSHSNFPTLLGQTFVALRMATPQEPSKTNEPSHYRLERAMFDAACAVNRLRAREGTGHGRPWLPSVTDAQARAAVEIIGCIAEYLLSVHNEGR
jgi:hypothetical protein